MKNLWPKVEIDSNWWDNNYREGIAQNWTIWNDRRLVEVVLKELGGGLSVLFVASGVGVGARALAAKRPELQITLCDYSTEALADAKRSMPESGWQFIEHDLQQVPWPFRSKQFDAVIVSEVLEHVENPWVVVNEAARVAKTCIVGFPISNDLLSDHHRWLFSTPDAHAVPGFQHLHQLYDKRLVLAVGKS